MWLRLNDSASAQPTSARQQLGKNAPISENRLYKIKSHIRGPGRGPNRGGHSPPGWIPSSTTISIYILRLCVGPPLQPFFRSRSPHFSSFFSKIVNKGKPFWVWSTTAEIFRHLQSLFLLCFRPVSSGTPLELYNFLLCRKMAVSVYAAELDRILGLTTSLFPF